ncbi:MAG: DMT family transporter [Alphaproteobacteria bacterium]
MTLPADTAAKTATTELPSPSDIASDTGRGIALMILAVGLYSIMDAMVKWLGPSYPTLELVFFRSLFAFVPIAYVLYRSGSLAALRTKNPLGHGARAMAGLISISLFFYAYTRMPLANVVAISFAAPLLVTALSIPLLGERVGWRRWTAVLVGFLGVVIMVKPDAGLFDRIAVLALLGTVFYALVIVSIRKLSRTETPLAIVFYYALTATLVTGAVMPFVWVMPDAEGWVLLILVGVIGGIAQFAMTHAFRLAEVSIVAPFDYLHIIWAALLGFFIWGEVPGNTIWIGVPIVMASGIYILFREAHLGLPRGIARRLTGRR